MQTLFGLPVRFPEVTLVFEPEPDDGWPVASECDELEVGRAYLVPCVNGTPVIGEPHVDNDHFNHTELHYHCDSRFHDGELGPFAIGGPANCAQRGRSEPTVLEARRCIRTTPAPFTDGILAVCQMALHADYGFTEAKCGRCPHKGMPIINGVCSGHRLKWLDDGTIKHKPPYTFRIRGTKNELIIDTRVELGTFRIPIIEDFDGIIDLEFLDRNDELIFEKRFGYMRLSIGDTFSIHDGSDQYTPIAETRR